jgi:hypothetical protein
MLQISAMLAIGVHRYFQSRSVRLKPPLGLGLFAVFYAKLYQFSLGIGELAWKKSLFV